MHPSPLTLKQQKSRYDFYLTKSQWFISTFLSIYFVQGSKGRRKEGSQCNIKVQTRRQTWDQGGQLGLVRKEEKLNLKPNQQILLFAVCHICTQFEQQEVHKS